MKTLTIRLAGPFQSFGNEAQFSRRTTWNYPSKSAILGMISAALGYSRDDTRIKELNELEFSVRIDQPGTIRTEFQTVEWKIGGSRKLTYRDNILDAVFMVAISSEKDDMVEMINEALHHPKFQLYLGRRANVPAGILKTNIFCNQNSLETLESIPWQASEWYQSDLKKEKVISLEIMTDSNLLNAERSFLNNDNVITFSQKNRKHSYRSITQTLVKLVNPKYVDNSNHNVFDIL